MRVVVVAWVVLAALVVVLAPTVVVVAARLVVVAAGLVVVIVAGLVVAAGLVVVATVVVSRVVTGAGGTLLTAATVVGANVVSVLGLGSVPVVEGMGTDVTTCVVVDSLMAAVRAETASVVALVEFVEGRRAGAVVDADRNPTARVVVARERAELVNDGPDMR